MELQIVTDRRIEKLEATVDALRLKEVENSTVIHSIDDSMKKIATTTQQMSNWMAADNVREEANREFKLEIIGKLDKAQGRREKDSSDVKEALRISKENQTEIATIKIEKEKALKWWRNTAISLILLAISTALGLYIKGLFA